MGDFQATTERFLAWFKSVGGEFRDDLLEIQDLRSRDAGRGIIARKNVPEDTTLFTIPRSAIINIETSELSRKLPNVFDRAEDNENEDEEPLDSWSSLILVMLYEYLQGEASRWKPYIDVLPTSFDTPIFWSEEELKELEGTILTAEKIGKQESDEMIRSRIIPLVQHNAAIFYANATIRLSEDDLLALAHQIGSTIMSYAFDLDNGNEQSDDEEDGWVEDRDGQTMLGMVPMADILNANAEFNAHVNHGDNLEVNSLGSGTTAGTEILNYYGPLPSSELLRRYGYTTPEHHRYDVAELPWSLVRTTLSTYLDISEDLLQDIESNFEDDELEEYFLLERDTGDPSSEGKLSESVDLCEIPAELNEQLKLVLKALKKVKPEIASDKRKRDEVHTSVIAKALATKLSQYPTTAEEDDALLKKGGLSRRHRMAVEVRFGEKVLIGEAIASLVDDETEEVVAQRSGRSTKRSKN
ncbi:Ribosomal lysine N-methyltransferase 4 [Coniothyrium glycines]